MAISLGSLSACANKAFEVLNPYAEASDVELGQRNNQTIIEETGMEGESQNARHALEVMGSYRRAQAPQPAYPVVQPAEVRLMWVPDHLNKAGDLVPAHYYYLRVLNDRWAVQDAFDMEEQLRQGSTGGSSSVPWVYK
ncbi:MAG: hypothetical protein IT291_11390 [Deltaproteobacteria bacterium]|nr:hypothetical protein [Deltaproteobacteria bacterium]